MLHQLGQEFFGADSPTPFPLRRLPHGRPDSAPPFETRLLGLYCLAYLLIVFLIVFWIPGSDFDTLSSYIARIKLEEFGPLDRTGTLELQHLFPKFFDYLHKPFLSLGYFTTLPSFVLFVATLAIPYAVAPFRVAVITTVLIFSAQVLMAGVASLKNDLPLGAFALLAWALIAFGRKSTLYPAFCLCALAMLFGTKWTGAVIAAPLGLYFLWRCVRERMVTTRALIAIIVCVPLLWWFSSAGDYVSNYLRFGTPTPRPPWYENFSGGFAGLPGNLYRFISTNFLDTFDPVAAVLDTFARGQIWDAQVKATMHGKQIGYMVFNPSSTVATWGVAVLLVMTCCAATLFGKTAPVSIKIAAATALFYTAVLLYTFNYNTWINRYFIPAYVLGLLPTAMCLAKLKIGRIAQIGAFAYMCFVSLHVLLFNYERNLATTWVRSNDTKSSFVMEPFYAFSHLTDRDRLYFLGSRDNAEVYEAVRAAVDRGEGFAIFNGARGGDVPFVYPFIMRRDPANTFIINERYGQTWSHALCADVSYVLAYKARLADPAYTEIYDFRDRGETTLYERTGPC